MIEKGKSTPAQPEYKKEKGLPVPAWFIAVIAIAAVATMLFLPNLQQSASSGISDIGVQPQQPAPHAPVPPAVTPVGTETPTPTPTATKAQEPAVTAKVGEIPIEVLKNEGINIENVVVSQLSYGNGQLRGHIIYPDLPEGHGVSIKLQRLETPSMPIGAYFKPLSEFDFFFTVKEEDLNKCKIVIQIKK